MPATSPTTRRLRRRLAAGVAAVALAGAGAGGPQAAPAYAAPRPFNPGVCQGLEANQPLAAWQVNRLQPARVWPITRGEGVTVAVIDTGIDTTGNERVLPTGQVRLYDFAPAQDPEEVDCSHGTRVASLIIGQPGADPATNFSGIAPGAQVIGMRALAGSPSEELEPLEPTVEAINAAVDMGVDVINISQAGTETPAYAAAVRRALAAGIVVVAAAGNTGGSGSAPYPAREPGVIAVGMSNTSDQANPNSQFHPRLQVTVAAPGDAVLVLNPTGGGGLSWNTDTGTSFAAPLVSGTVALMLSADPTLTPAQVRERLIASADPPASGTPDPQLGYGIVNPYAAVTALPPSSGGDAGPAQQAAPAPDPRDRVTALRCWGSW